MGTRTGTAVIGLTAVIVAVTEETPRILTVRRVGHALASPVRRGMTEAWLDSPNVLPYGPFDVEAHRTLELGLTNWVKEQTGLELRYVEQLYTFGDRYRDPREFAGGPRVVSIGYIALVRETPLSGTGEATWRDWYACFPWEDWRAGRPAIIDEVVRPALEKWIGRAPEAGVAERRRERVSVAFGVDIGTWDRERVLERYELLYETGLVAEALRDAQIGAAFVGDEPPRPDPVQAEAARRLGDPMALDSRRVLATALGRLRGKLRYRPVVFELVPGCFTLLHLQRVVEALSGVRLHKQNFRRLVRAGKLVEATGRRERGGPGRPAELFRFRREVIRERHAPGVGVPSLRRAD